jgi:hypothetical protein
LNQMLMKTILDDFGFDCEIAENGKIAVENWKKRVWCCTYGFANASNEFEATEYIRNTMKSSIQLLH